MRGTAPQLAELAAGGGDVALQFEGVTFPVVFRNCPEVLTALGRALHGWPFRVVAIPSDGPHIEISPDRDGYRTALTWLDEELCDASAAATVCSLTVDLAEALILDNRQLLCLHCGAALFDGRLVVFTGTSHAGKSTLVSRLAAAGVTVFCDDLLLLVAPEDHGRSLGVRGRLRLPLPESSSAEFRQFVSEFAGPGDGRYLYLDTPNFADFGTTAPIGAVVVLDRSEDAIAHLAATGRAEALQHLIQRNVARGEAAEGIIDRLRRVMDKAICLRLRYSDLEDAVSLIVGTFGQWPSQGITPTPSSVTNMSVDMPAVADEMVARDRLYQRRSDVSVRDIDGELFLASAEGDAIWHLNPLGAGVWNLLADPVSPHGVVEMLMVAFPEADLVQINKDVDVLFAGLAANDLIVASPAANRPAQPKQAANDHRESDAPCA